MDPASINRGIMSAGLWVATIYGISLATGGDFTLMDSAVDGAIMGASAVGSDLAHSWIGMTPTTMTSALGAGAMYTGIQAFYNGSTDYAVNFGMAAANDVAVELWSASMAK